MLRIHPASRNWMISTTDRKPAILSLIPPYCEQFTQSSNHLPVPFQSLYEPENLQLNYLQLHEKACKNVCREPITEIQVSHLENLTRGQTCNKQLFRYRAGRITASLIQKLKWCKCQRIPCWYIYIYRALFHKECTLL